MSTLVESPSAWTPEATRPLDEAVWQVWVAKGHTLDRQTSAARVKFVKWASILGLLAAAGMWSPLAQFQLVIEFLVAASAMLVMFHALQAGHYAVAAAFGAIAVLYNPVVPAFNFAGDWQRALVVASAIPFVASLAWPASRMGRIGQNG